AAASGDVERAAVRRDDEAHRAHQITGEIQLAAARVGLRVDEGKGMCGLAGDEAAATITGEGDRARATAGGDLRHRLTGLDIEDRYRVVSLVGDVDDLAAGVNGDALRLLADRNLPDHLAGFDV